MIRLPSSTSFLAAWLWDNRVAAIGTGCPGVEALPMNLADEGLLHYRALPLLGLPGAAHRRRRHRIAANAVAIK